MALILSQNDKPRLPPVEGGTHQAVCYGLIDLGTQQTEFRGQPKEQQQVIILWELPHERIDIERDGEVLNLPRVMRNKYTLSLSPKANLRHTLAVWRTKDFTEEELKSFDLKTIVGANCLLNVSHKISARTNQPYAYVSGVGPLMKGMTKLKPETPILIYEMMTDHMDIPEAVPDWIKEIIQQSKEWKAVSRAANDPRLKHREPGEDAGDNVPDETNDYVAPDEIPDDDIPF